jgi:hypothetical protein
MIEETMTYALLLAVNASRASISPALAANGLHPDSAATALSFTITNPDTSAALSAVLFTDTLPAGLAIDDPNGENGTCGSASVITAAPATQTISLSGGSIKAAASCTSSLSITAAQTGTFQNTTSPVSSAAGLSSSGAAATLTVIPPPTVTVSHIKENAKFTYGQVVRPIYSCAQPKDAVGLTTFAQYAGSVASQRTLNVMVKPTGMGGALRPDLYLAQL